MKVGFLVFHYAMYPALLNIGVIIKFSDLVGLCIYPKKHKIGIINYIFTSSLNGSTIMILPPFFVEAETSSS